MRLFRRSSTSRVDAGDKVNRCPELTPWRTGHGETLRYLRALAAIIAPVPQQNWKTYAVGRPLGLLLLVCLVASCTRAGFDALGTSPRDAGDGIALLDAHGDAAALGDGAPIDGTSPEAVPFLAATQNGELFEIDPVTQEVSLVGALATASFAGALRPGTRSYLYFASPTMGELRSYDLDSGDDVSLGEVGVLSTDDISRIDFDRNGMMWFISNDDVELYQLDLDAPVLQANHIRSYLGTISWGGDLAFAPDGTLYVGDRDGGLFAFENLGDPPVIPAAPTRSMTTAGLTDGYTGLIFDAFGTLWATDFGSTLYTIDLVTGVATPRFDLGVAVNDLSLGR